MTLYLDQFPQFQFKFFISWTNHLVVEANTHTHKNIGWTLDHIFLSLSQHSHSCGTYTVSHGKEGNEVKRRQPRETANLRQRERDKQIKNNNTDWKAGRQTDRQPLWEFPKGPTVTLSNTHTSNSKTNWTPKNKRNFFFKNRRKKKLLTHFCQTEGCFFKNFIYFLHFFLFFF